MYDKKNPALTSLWVPGSFFFKELSVDQSENADPFSEIFIVYPIIVYSLYVWYYNYNEYFTENDWFCFSLAQNGSDYFTKIKNN